jgi:predicted nucleic acid-binding Zn ribbon protein
MARKRAAPLSQRERRRVRIQQMVFVALGILVLTALILGMIKY